ncbi:hypothetical protein HPGCJGGD_4300 [Methylobacterium haplocladii]|nr:hypothetical protein HPGCJGGD_4300 [Methylobacterium haplocladii]
MGLAVCKTAVGCGGRLRIGSDLLIGLEGRNQPACFLSISFPGWISRGAHFSNAVVTNNTLSSIKEHQRIRVEAIMGTQGAGDTLYRI